MSVDKKNKLVDLLLVDDDDELRNGLIDYFRQLGYGAEAQPVLSWPYLFARPFVPRGRLRFRDARDDGRRVAPTDQVREQRDRNHPAHRRGID